MSKALMRFLAVLVLAAASVLGTCAVASAQVIVSPNASPTLNDGGWVYGMAILLVALGVLVVGLVVFGYLRFAPRFQREEGTPRPIRAPRLVPGAEAPRRPVNVTAAPAAVPAPTVAAPAEPVPAHVPAASAEGSVAAERVVPTPSTAAESSVAAEPAAAAPSAPAPAPAPAAGGEKHELDQETFDKVLAELLEKGTTRRVAEGQARRAAMIAARKKAGG